MRILRLASLLFWLAPLAAIAQDTATLTIDTAKPVAKVSPTLYGIMTEEINYSYDGGLYAELVSNRTFQTNRGPTSRHWTLVQNGNSRAIIEFDKTTGPSAAIPHSLKFTVDIRRSAGRSRLLQHGLLGHGPSSLDHLSGLLLRQGDGPAIGDLTIRLVNDNTGAVAASTTRSRARQLLAEIRLHSQDRHARLLCRQSSGISRAAPRDRMVLPRLALSAHLQQRAQRQAHRPHGEARRHASRLPPLSRRQLSRRRPSRRALRLEEDHRPSRRSPHPSHPVDLPLLRRHGPARIPHVVRRPSHGAAAGRLLRILSPSRTTFPRATTSNPTSRTRSTRSSTSPATPPPIGARSARRTAIPRPSSCTFMEIGNEEYHDESGTYDARFAQFYKAIKQKYPELQLVAAAPVTLGSSRHPRRQRPCLHTHFYRTAQQFFVDTHHYDSYDRNGPKILVGEWATREGSPTTNLGAALGDAAWMTGLERNSDIVVMASYAPLFVNVNPGGMQWPSDLIGYDALNSYGSPSYYAQVMFSTHLGDQILDSKLDTTNPRLFECRNLRLEDPSSPSQAGQRLVDAAVGRRSNSPEQPTFAARRRSPR